MEASPRIQTESLPHWWQSRPFSPGSTARNGTARVFGSGWSTRRKRGQGGGPLRYKFVPSAAKGTRHPQGRSEPASGAGRAAALTGNGAEGASQSEKRSPAHSSYLTGRLSRTLVTC